MKKKRAKNPWRKRNHIIQLHVFSSLLPIPFFFLLSDGSLMKKKGRKKEEKEKKKSLTISVVGGEEGGRGSVMGKTSRICSRVSDKIADRQTDRQTDKQRMWGEHAVSSSIYKLLSCIYLQCFPLTARCSARRQCGQVGGDPNSATVPESAMLSPQ